MVWLHSKFDKETTHNVALSWIKLATLLSDNLCLLGVRLLVVLHYSLCYNKQLCALVCRWRMNAAVWSFK